MLTEQNTFMVADNVLDIELVYIGESKQNLISLKLPLGSDIKTAIEKSKILQQNPEINLHINKVGIFNKIKSLDYVLKNKDRIEIYRPLRVEPKDRRRNKAASSNPRK